MTNDAHDPVARSGPASLAVLLVTLASIFLASGAAALPWVIGDALDFFYQPRLLAALHALTVGWLTLSVLGVLIRIVPALAKQPLPGLGTVRVASGLLAFGAAGMAAHFWIGRWPALALAAGVVVIAALVVGGSLLVCLARARAHSATRLGLVLSLSFLFAAAALGTTLAADKSLDFMPGSMLSNLAAHAHLAALGWIGLAISAVGYRMLPALLLPTDPASRCASHQIVALAVAVSGLALSRLGMIPGPALPWAAAAALALGVHLAIVARFVATRRMPIDWPIRHVIAGGAFLAWAIVLGLGLAAVDAGSALGNRLAGAYGAAGILGWMGNVVLGMSQPLVPGLVLGARAEAGLSRLTRADVTLPELRPAIFLAWNAGVFTLVGGLVTGSEAAAVAGSATLAIGALVHAGSTLRTARFARFGGGRARRTAAAFERRPACSTSSTT